MNICNNNCVKLEVIDLCANQIFVANPGGLFGTFTVIDLITGRAIDIEPDDNGVIELGAFFSPNFTYRMHQKDGSAWTLPYKPLDETVECVEFKLAVHRGMTYFSEYESYCEPCEQVGAQG